jgi:putative ABC transport system permease protein
MLRGRIVAVKGVPVAQVKPKPGSEWALRGDRGLTYAEELPQASQLVEGTWWSKSYEGPALVSLTEDIAQGLDLHPGDSLTVNVLGRDVEARVASLRRVNWRSLGINFVMVFSPNALKGAPHSFLVTVETQGAVDEGKLVNDIAGRFPSVTAVRVKDVIATVSQLLSQMMAAVRGINVVTLLTGVLVMAGALAAGLAARGQEAVILRTYGVRRSQLILSHAVEYGVMGLVAGIFGVITGSLAAWYLAARVLEMPWHFSPGTALLTALIAMALSIAGGLMATLRALTLKPSAVLRDE